MENTSTTQNDAVRPSDEQFRKTYDDAYCVWASLHAAAVDNPCPPLVPLRDAFRLLPSFPRNASIKRKTKRDISQLYAHGYATWDASVLRCRGLPSIQRSAEFEVATTTVTSLSIETTDEYKDWFHGRPVFVAVLALAWSYILSARWAERMPGWTLSYGELVENNTGNRDAVVVDIGEATPDEARWWSAILAEDGWRATMHFDNEPFWSPWCFQRKGGPRLVLAAREAQGVNSDSSRAPSYADASRYLERFCARHHLADQSQAALAAILLLPPLRYDKTLRLPLSAPTASSLVPAPPTIADAPNFGSNEPGTNDLDRLLVLSCYTRGLRPLLSSVFYEPSVECNAVSAWLQGTFSAVDTLSPGPLVLGRMLMDRSPNVAFLWLGATILGYQEKLLREVRYGLISIDLLSAAWCSTTQTFIQLPTSSCKTHVARADECRLLFFCQADDHSRLPIVPWKPFGVTPLEDADLDVRVHAKCKHQLRYRGFTWEREDGRPREWLSRLWRRLGESLGGCLALVACLAHCLVAKPNEHSGRTPTKPLPKIRIPHEGMDPSKDSISENATRSIFGWLRVDGWCRHEKDIYGHEWFDPFEDEDEDEDVVKDEKSSQVVAKSATALWASMQQCP